MRCEYYDSCALIHKMNKSVPFTVNMMKIKYCDSNKIKCARYKLLHVCERKDIPNDLWPSDEVRGLELMEEQLNAMHQAPNNVKNEGISD